MKVVVVDKEYNSEPFEDISSVLDRDSGKLVLFRDKEVVAVYNKECWIAWRKT